MERKGWVVDGLELSAALKGGRRRGSWVAIALGLDSIHKDRELGEVGKCRTSSQILLAVAGGPDIIYCAWEERSRVATREMARADRYPALALEVWTL